MPDTFAFFDPIKTFSGPQAGNAHLGYFELENGRGERVSIRTRTRCADMLALAFDATRLEPADMNLSQLEDASACIDEIVAFLSAEREKIDARLANERDF